MEYADRISGMQVVFGDTGPAPYDGYIATYLAIYLKGVFFMLLALGNIPLIYP
jgi:hypothetical protein